MAMPWERYSAAPVAAEAPAEQAPPVRARDMLRSIYGQGVGFGFGDEFEARATSMATGRPYEGELERIRGEIEAFEKNYPGISIGGELYGAVVSPGSALGAIAKGGNAVRAAVQGGIQGAAYGAGKADGSGPWDRFKGATAGAGGGIALGAAGSKIIDAGKAIAGQVGTTLRGLTNQPAEAARRVAVAQNIDNAGARPGLSNAEFQAAQSRGQPVSNMERGGEMTRAVADSAATSSPEARATFGRVIDDRVNNQGERVVEYVRTLARTPGNAAMTREALEAAAQKARGGFYMRAYRDGSNGVSTPALLEMTKTPAMQSAMKEAVTSLRNKRGSGRSGGPEFVNGSPTLEFWDQVKRNLDSRYSVFSRQGDKEAAADIAGLKGALVAELDSAVPSYRDARGFAATFFQADNALEAGEKFVLGSQKLHDAHKALSKMTPEERELFREGFVSKLVETVEATGDRRNVVPKIWGTKTARDKITMAIGPAKAKEMEAFMYVETLMNDARSIMGGSPTVRRLVEMGLSGSATGAGGVYGLMTGDPSGLAGAAVIAGLTRGKFMIDRRMGDQLAKMLSSSDAAVFQKGVQIIAGRPKMLEALRKSLAVASGQQGARIEVPMIQRATQAEENEQPNR